MGSKPKQSPESKAAAESAARLNELTIKRLQRDQEALDRAESEKQRLLEAGRLGRRSLLSAGFLGFGTGASINSGAAGGLLKPRE